MISNKSISFSTLLLISLILIDNVNAWYESSKCTTITQTDNNNNSNEQDDEINLPRNNEISTKETNVLKLNCENNNLIFIAWSHYGQHNNKTDDSSSSSCYFSPKDCTVNVDYVANECNGLNSCQISLDSQYLHSCKSYSDYLFIIYDCIETKSTVNICDMRSSVDTLSIPYLNYQDDSFEQRNEAIYLQTPNYPNEYLNNLDCNCTMKTTTTIQNNYLNPIEYEFLEFDLESSSSSSSSSLETSAQNTKTNDICTKDYLTIQNLNETSSTKLCGTFSPFLSIEHSIESKTKQQVIETNLRFTSDDALTRRGFWIKVKSSQYYECPDNNFILIDNICIRIYNNELLTWYEAQNFCLDKGYSLAIIDNFELDKQMNRALFSNIDQNDQSNDSIKPLKTNNKINNLLKKFWTGIRHLNETNWFDYKNELIKFKRDEIKWWPWLVVDSSTYNIGSCVAKRQNSLYLEDCYKRMPFACQFKPKKLINKQKQTRIQLKCGNNVNFLNEINSKPSVKKKISNVTSTSTEPALILVHNSNEIIENNQINETNLVAGFSKQSIVETNKNISGNSTLLICLISSITILIAFINSIVILVICKRRKLLLQNKDSKSSSHDTISSSGHNINNNFDEMTTSAGTNSSSSLTFSARNLSSTSKGGLFNAKTNNEPIFLDNNFRRSVFVNNKTNNLLQQQQINRNDPLGHIYETISVSSTASHSNLANTNRISNNNNNSNYNLFNHYHLNQQQQQLQNINNYNESEASEEFFLNKKVIFNGQQQKQLTLNNNKRNNVKLLSTTATNFRPIRSENNKQLVQTVGSQFDNRFSELNVSNSNSSSSPSSSTTTTTLTDVLNNSCVVGSNHFVLLNQSNKHLLLCSSNDLLQQQQQHQHHNLIQTFSRNSFKNNNHLLNNFDQHNHLHQQQQHFHQSNDFKRNNILIQSNNGPLNYLTNPVEAIV